MLDPAAMRAAGFVYEGIGRARARRRMMEAIILAGGKAERLGDAAGGGPKALVPIAGHPLIAYQVSQLRRVGVDARDRQLCPRPGSLFVDDALAPRRRDRPRRGAGAARSRRRAAIRRRAPRGRRARSSRSTATSCSTSISRRCSHATATAASPRRSRSLRWSLRSASSTSTRATVVIGLPRGAAAAVLGQHRLLRPRRGGARAAARAGRPRADDVPRARRRGKAARLSSRGRLVDGQHAQAAPPRGRLLRGPPRAAARRRPSGMTERYRFDARRVEKPWG